jgi:Holliday junction DNA helicase RuvB
VKEKGRTPPGPAPRVPDPAYNGEEDQEETTLRPRRLAEFIGQDKQKENLAVYIEAAKQRGEHLDHVFLSGPPGLGKTTLAAKIGRAHV